MKKLNVLVDLRPALQGFAGIPQEARLLFRELCLEDSLAVEGFLQMDSSSLAPGIPSDGKAKTDHWSIARKFHSHAQVIISATEDWWNKDRSVSEVIKGWIKKHLRPFILFSGPPKINLTKFESHYFEDFVWRYLFSKTLPISDFRVVTSKNHRVCCTSWEEMQDAGLDSLSISPTPKYPELNTDDFDIFIAQTPYPGRVSSNTTLIIRYHDAIPIFLPHTIPGKRKHEAIHFYALMNNVECGAWFSCVSETSRQELLRVFPEAESRAVTIHNMVSPQYFEENSSFEEVRRIISLRRSLAIDAHDGEVNEYQMITPKFKSAADEVLFYRHALEGKFRYLLVVSTIDPRKNHATCMAAWQIIKRTKDPDLKLVFVGSLGWDYEHLKKDLATELGTGGLFLLDKIPSNELRVLYRHASATVCPSYAEGFDFSGVEAMRCGGVVVASDIAVHREIYEDAAEYFNPYSSESAASALIRIVYDEDCEAIKVNLRKRADVVSARYLPKNILPLWRSFLDTVAEE